MPRYIGYRPQQKTSLKISRSKHYRVSGYNNWIDPFPSIEGTLPEKIVYAALSFRGIPFWSQDEVNFSIPDIGFSNDYRPDFVLPTLRIIIEVQGAYFHSMPKTIEADAFKFAIYQQTGWKGLAWWDFDITHDVNKLFAEEPLLAGYPVKQDFSSETTNGRKVIRDDSKGIVTLNKKRGARSLYKKPTARLRKSKVKTYGQYTV